jgi:folate-binding protein YgfZ
VVCAQNPTALEREYDALVRGAGFAILDDRLVVRVTGDDRVSFLHGMCSNDVKGKGPGAIVAAMFLTEHAQVLGECFIWVDKDALILESDRAAWPRTREHLERFLVADDVEIEEAEAPAVMAVEGPRAARTLGDAAIDAKPPPNPWSYTTVKTLLVGRMERFGNDGFSLIGPLEASREIAAMLEARGAAPVSGQALDIIRVENGLARAGVDAGDKTIALEARLERAISFTKGCYVGQETIERATARGALKRKLFGLRFTGRIVEAGAPLSLDGKEVGRVTSSVVSPRFGPIGLAILHHSAWQPGTILAATDSSGETAAAVSELPFG